MRQNRIITRRFGLNFLLERNHNTWVGFPANKNFRKKKISFAFLKPFRELLHFFVKLAWAKICEIFEKKFSPKLFSWKKISAKTISFVAATAFYYIIINNFSFIFCLHFLILFSKKFCICFNTLFSAFLIWQTFRIFSRKKQNFSHFSRVNEMRNFWRIFCLAKRFPLFSGNPTHE